MSIIKTSQQVTINKTYEERIEERTRSIRIEIPNGETPKISILRETAIYHDNVLFSTSNGKRFQITMNDLTSVNKQGLLKEIADTIDLIANTK